MRPIPINELSGLYSLRQIWQVFVLNDGGEKSRQKNEGGSLRTLVVVPARPTAEAQRIGESGISPIIGLAPHPSSIISRLLSLRLAQEVHG